MMNLYGGQGMGANGMGVGGGGNLNMAALLAAMQQGQNGGMAQPGTMSPMGPSGATPMSNYIQPQGMGMMGQHPAAGPVAAPVTAPNNMAAVQQLLQSLGKGQTGVAPTGAGGAPAPLPAAQNPMAGAQQNPGFLQMLLQHLQSQQPPPAVTTGSGAGGMT